MGLEALDS